MSGLSALPAGFVQALRAIPGRALVASDGGSNGRSQELRRAAVGFALRVSPGRIQGWGVRRPGADQSPFGAEAWGLRLLLLALREAGETGDIWIDNLQVVRIGRRVIAGAPIPKYMTELWAEVALVGQAIQGLRIHWVPSHGKRPEW